MEHGEHFLCSLGSSQRAALPMGHSLFTPQLLLRSIQHQSSPLVPMLLLETIQWASSCLYTEFGWLCDYFFIESKSNFIKNVIQPRAAIMKMGCCECSSCPQYQKMDEMLDVDFSANRNRYSTRNPGPGKKALFSNTNIEHEQTGNSREQWKRLNS